MHVVFAVVLAFLGIAQGRGPNDHEYGYFVANDPLDAQGERFSLAVRHCYALEEGLRVVSFRHGWLVSIEVAAVDNPSDLEPTMRNGEFWAHCRRVVEYETEYSALDPMAAVQAIVSAHNATSPPFTARAEWCGGNICVRADEIRMPDGNLQPVSLPLDVPVTVVGSTLRAQVDSVLTQVAATAAHPLTGTVPGGASSRWWDVDATTTPAAGIPARNALAEIVGHYNQAAFERSWREAVRLEERDRSYYQMAEIHGEFVGWSHRQGLTPEAAEEEWDRRRAQLAAAGATAEVEVDPPPLTPGVGPGSAWSVLVGYDQDGPTRYTFLLADVLAPRDLAPDRMIPGTVPTPGADTDGDGIANPVDRCPGTPAGELVPRDGCSLSQSCPCDQGWATNGEYRTCIDRAVKRLIEHEVLPRNQGGATKQSWYDKECAH